MYNFPKATNMVSRIVELIVAQSKLGKFVHDEMRKRDMSMRQFADFVGTNHATISHLINDPEPPTPTLELLSKLARATGVDVCTLVSMALPNERHANPDPESRLLAERIGKLPPDAQSLIKALIANTIFENSQKGL